MLTHADDLMLAFNTWLKQFAEAERMDSAEALQCPLWVSFEDDSGLYLSNLSNSPT